MSLNKVLIELLEDNRMGYADVERQSGMRYQSIKDALEGNDTNSLRLVLSIAELTQSSVDEILVKAGVIKETTVNKHHPKGNIKLTPVTPTVKNGHKMDHQMIYVPGFEGEDGLMMMNIDGDNMEGLIADSDYVIYKEVGAATLVPGKVYMFKTDNQVMVKRLKNVSENGLMLTSDNTFYAPLILKKEDIKKVYIVRGFVSKNTSPRIAYG